jgi:hypothetical protein
LLELANWCAHIQSTALFKEARQLAPVGKRLSSCGCASILEEKKREMEDALQFGVIIYNTPDGR